MPLKFVPLTVKVTPGSPAVTLVGEILTKVGTGLIVVTVRSNGAEVPPPGAGLKTVI